MKVISAARLRTTVYRGGRVPYRYREGIPWRDLPVRFGDWKNMHRRLRR
ncbi:transposase [Acetobacter sicerae]|nr:transposase [Acetobacter sicerae]